MSVQAISWVLDHSKSTGLARLVLISLANHASGSTGEAYPSVATIAREAGISGRSVQRHLRHLESIGELKVEPRSRDNGSDSSSMYRLLSLPRQSDTPPPSESHPRHRVTPVRKSPAPRQTVTRGVTPVSPLEPSLNLEGTDVPSSPAKPARARDAIFDALAKAGHGIDVGTLVPRQLGGQIGVAKRDLLEVEPDVRPEEIHRRAYNYRKMHPDWTLSATALVKHWHSVASAKTTADEARQADIARRQRF